MPIYGYACEACGHTLDALQKMSDAPLSDCPECREPALRRQLSAPRFRLKGQGWYETDFKSDKQRNLAGDGEAKAAPAPDGKAESATGKPTDGKPDGTADKKTAASADKSGDKPDRKKKGESKTKKGSAGDKAGAD